MPKHHIYPIGSEPADRRIELHWQRDGGVQVATAVWAGGDEPDRDSDQWDGQFVDLSRGQLNYLIKKMRMARDQAYGRDQ
jgi:hypothetical protein